MRLADRGPRTNADPCAPRDHVQTFPNTHVPNTTAKHSTSQTLVRSTITPLHTHLLRVVAHAVILCRVLPRRAPTSCEQITRRPRRPAPLSSAELSILLSTTLMPRLGPPCPALPAPQHPTPCVPRGARPYCSTPCATARLPYHCMARFASGSHPTAPARAHTTAPRTS